MNLQERFADLSFKGPGFDQLRLIAATIVVLHHSSGVERSDVRLDPLFYYSHGYIHFGFFAVVVFFSISGFLVTPGLLRSGDVIDFMVRRTLRIGPALIAVVLATMLIIGPILTTLPFAAYFSDPQMYRYAKNAATLMSDHLPGVNSPTINGSLWTLHFEVLSYATLAFVSLLGILHRRVLFVAFCVACYAANVAFYLVPGLAATLPDRLVTLMSVFVYFATAAAMFVCGDRIPYSRAVAACAIVAALIAMPLGWGVVVLPLSVSYLTVFLGLTAWPGRYFLKHDYSYGVYLIHCPVLVSIMVLFPSLNVWWLVAIIVISITLALAQLSWTFVESPALQFKKPIRDWLNERVKRLGIAVPMRPKT